MLQEAEATLAAIRRRTAPPSARAWENAEQLDARIVAQGAGWPARDVAIWAKCSLRTVHRARAAAGRDTEWGHPLKPTQTLDVQQRRTEVQRRADNGQPATQIALGLNLSVSTVRRYLGRRKN